jgi:hypothetical protein
VEVAPVEEAAVGQILKVVEMTGVGLIVLDVELKVVHQLSLGGQPQGGNSEAGQPVAGLDRA